MKRYLIYYSVTKEIGSTFPQCQDIMLPVHMDDPYFVGAYSWRVFDPKPIVPTLILHRRAKRTDLLSAVGPGLIFRLVVSPRMSDTLFQYTHAGIQRLEIPVKLPKGETLAYHLIDGYDCAYEFIDFSRTQFIHSTESGEIQQPIEISSQYELRKLMAASKYNEHILIHDIHLLDSAPDFFSLYCVVKYNASFIISQRIKDALDNAGITGVNYVPLEQV